MGRLLFSSSKQQHKIMVIINHMILKMNNFSDLVPVTEHDLEWCRKWGFLY